MKRLMAWLSFFACLAALGGGSRDFDNPGTGTSANSSRIQGWSPTKDTTHTIAIWWKTRVEGIGAGVIRGAAGYGGYLGIRGDDTAPLQWECAVNDTIQVEIKDYSATPNDAWLFFACVADGTNFSSYYADPVNAPNLVMANQAAFSGDIPETFAAAAGGYNTSVITQQRYHAEGGAAYYQEWDYALTLDQLKEAMWNPGCVRQGLIMFITMLGSGNTNGSSEPDLSMTQAATTLVLTGTGTGNSQRDGPPVARVCL